MNTFWLKIAGVAVAVLGVIILINVFSSSEPEPQPVPEEHSLSQQVDRDREKFLSRPKAVDLKGFSDEQIYSEINVLSTPVNVKGEAQVG